MGLQSIIEQAAFDELPETSVIGKDLFVKNEKENKFFLNLSEDEAGKIAFGKQREIDLLNKNNQELLSEKKTKATELQEWKNLGKTRQEIADLIKAGKGPDADQLKSQFEQQYASQITDLTNQINSLTETNKSLDEKVKEGQQLKLKTLHQQEIETARNTHGLNALGEDYVRMRTVMVPESEGSEKLVPRVVDPLTGDFAWKAGALKTIDQLIEEAKLDANLSGMFMGGKAGGSNADPNQRPPVGSGSVRSDDISTIENNLEDIASGKVKVV